MLGNAARVRLGAEDRRDGVCGGEALAVACEGFLIGREDAGGVRLGDHAELVAEEVEKQLRLALSVVFLAALLVERVEAVRTGLSELWCSNGT